MDSRDNTLLADNADDNASMQPHVEPAAGEGLADSTPDDNGRATPSRRPVEHGGPRGPEPTRYGDWEKKGRCIDF